MKTLKIILLLVVSLGMVAFTSNLNPDKTISEIVVDQDNLSTLLTALEAAGLDDVLSEEGPYTVFAPTNEAFENLPEGKLDELLKPENKDELIAVLKYHVISGKVHASDLREKEMVATLEGRSLEIAVHESDDDYTSDGAESMKTISVNNVPVQEADIMASNGIIHIIDGVMIPSDAEVIGAAQE